MNFFRKRKRQVPEEGEIVGDPERKKPRSVVSWIKDKVNKLMKTEVSTASAEFLSETPAHLRTVRYIMTPTASFSPSTAAADLRDRTFYELYSTVAVTESKNYEFKAAGGRYPTQILPEHIRKYGSAFLNSSGGILLAGILDNGLVQGVRCNKSYQNTIRITIQKEFDKFRPKVGQDKFSVKFVPVSRRQNNYERSRDLRYFEPDMYVLEISVRKGEMGELYEDGLHQVFVRREGSVEGPLSPMKIKEIVLHDYRQILENKKRKRIDTPSNNITEKADQLTPSNNTKEKPEQPKFKKSKISPIRFDID